MEAGKIPKGQKYTKIEEELNRLKGELLNYQRNNRQVVCEGLADVLEELDTLHIPNATANFEKAVQVATEAKRYSDKAYAEFAKCLKEQTLAGQVLDGLQKDRSQAVVGMERLGIWDAVVEIGRWAPGKGVAGLSKPELQAAKLRFENAVGNADEKWPEHDLLKKYGKQ